MQNNDSKVIVALDYADAASALKLVNQLDPALCKLKVGKELFTAAGPQLVEKLIAKDFKVFLDLKFHDIPTPLPKPAKLPAIWAYGCSTCMPAAAAP